MPLEKYLYYQLFMIFWGVCWST